MKVKYIGSGSTGSCLAGKIYKVISIENGWYRIIDESGEDYLYSPKDFEIVGSVDDEEIMQLIAAVKGIGNYCGNIARLCPVCKMADDLAPNDPCPISRLD